MPTRIHPAPIITAPNHHNPPTRSLKTIIPRTAVTKKFAEVFVMDTFVVEGAAVRARVNRAHIMKLLRRLRPKHIYFIKHQSVSIEKSRNLGVVGARTARTMTSTIPSGKFNA
jgi:hypothetical protein